MLQDKMSQLLQEQETLLKPEHHPYLANLSCEVLAFETNFTNPLHLSGARGDLFRNHGGVGADARGQPVDRQRGGQPRSARKGGWNDADRGRSQRRPEPQFPERTGDPQTENIFRSLGIV